MTNTLDLVRSLTDEEWQRLAGALLTTKFPTARPDQLRPDGDWSTWLVLAGRGWGKTRAGAEDVVDDAIAHPGDYFVCAPTFRDMRAVCVEGPSGLLRVLARRAIKHEWNLTTTQIALANGSRIYCGSADEPDRWRGYNFRGGWCDEVAAWRRPDTLTQLRLATRMGDRPRIVVTTTPKPTALLRQMVGDPSTVVTRGSTWDNAENLSPAALDELRRTYAGTRLGRQELEGELLLDTPGALWSLASIDAARHPEGERLPDFDRVVVGVDPAVTSGEDADLTGIVSVGRAGDEFWVLSDASGRYTPDGTAQVAIGELDRHDGDRIVGEVNNGGDYIGTVIRHADRNVPYAQVRASRGKRVRAEPAAALYEQGRVHHVGDLGEMEDQLCQWTPDSTSSPDRMDALVWALTDLAEARRGRRLTGVFAA